VVAQGSGSALLAHDHVPVLLVPARLDIVRAHTASGSPITGAAPFLDRGYAWDFNYRGDLVFLDQARLQAPALGLHVEDGWLYFIHGWLAVIAEVFRRDIPVTGPVFE
jgi:hypothetical protein